jgi:hypothetical protein
MQCLPEGTLLWNDDFKAWVPSNQIGMQVYFNIAYAVPYKITDTTAATPLDPTTTQIGGTHYKDYAIQPVEFITRNNLPFLDGCVIKRVCRHRAKNGAEDIRKAIHELQLILKYQYNEQP